MLALKILLGLALLVPLIPMVVWAQPTAFEALAAQCAPGVHPTTLQGIVQTESGWHPYAIGVLGGRLARQPRSHAEAVATAQDLARQGYNFSLGLGQVNRYNLARLGETYASVFHPCRNLKAGSAILQDCYQRARARFGHEQQALHAALSCYYAGNFQRGLAPDSPGRSSYVERVVANSARPPQPVPAARQALLPAAAVEAPGAAKPIPVVPAVQSGAAPVAQAARIPPRRQRASAASAATSASPPPWVTFTGPAPSAAPGPAPAAPPVLTPEQEAADVVVRVRRREPAASAPPGGLEPVNKDARTGSASRPPYAPEGTRVQYLN
ncbi:hypothetical protein BUE93_20345 [Chromobacterium amazonense]|uniref:Transglycosylase SLT domain-containing protein n=1 Tax=Chromobacterium amazonense TaxID=1382803 RepID=A0A2S9WZA7_9NEIS|nr:lytic transglycosylase domain-containing protein [Chromobacterium amazonense]PRP68799.1 hypothetical protein BUE93_20345 [Chromobacterium amazonense]